MVKSIRRMQEKRYKRSGYYNANATPQQIAELFAISTTAHLFTKQAQKNLQLSTRSLLHTMRVARTIADASASSTIETPHVAEAIQYRRRFNNA